MLQLDMPHQNSFARERTVIAAAFPFTFESTLFGITTLDMVRTRWLRKSNMENTYFLFLLDVRGEQRGFLLLARHGLLGPSG